MYSFPFCRDETTVLTRRAEPVFSQHKGNALSHHDLLKEKESLHQDGEHKAHLRLQANQAHGERTCLIKNTLTPALWRPRQVSFYAFQANPAHTAGSRPARATH